MQEEKSNQSDEKNSEGQEFIQPPITADYFTEEIQKSINEMSEDEMFNELVGLEGTRTWIALLKYNQLRLRPAQSAVLSSDPFKEPVVIARNQGVMLGLSDLQNAIIFLKREREEEEKEKKKDSKE